MKNKQKKVFIVIGILVIIGVSFENCVGLFIGQKNAPKE